MSVIKYCSDLHVDINTKYYDISNVELMQKLNLYDVDILIIAGDIAEYPKNLHFADYLSSHYPKLRIIEIGSNHLYYSCINLNMTMKEIDKACKKHNEINPNYYYLERDTVVLDNIKFIGCAMWTTMAEHQVGRRMKIMSCLNDFQYILAEKNRRFNVKDAVDLHNKSKRFITKEVNNTLDNQECIVITHHAPFYEYHSEVSHAFGIDMSKTIKRFKKCPTLWVSGHTHINDKDRYIQNKGFKYVMVASNQFGYKGEAEHGSQFDAWKTFDSNKRLEI